MPDPMRAPLPGQCSAHLLDGASRRFATVMFTDMEDSSGLGEQLDLDTFAAMIVEQTAIAANAVHRHGGRIADFTGDGVLAVWLARDSAPSTTARRGLAAAAEIAGKMRAAGALSRLQGAPHRRLRVGIHSGEILVQEAGDGLQPFLFGPTLHRARRLEQAGKRDADRDAVINASCETLSLAGATASPGDRRRGWVGLGSGTPGPPPTSTYQEVRP